MKKVFLILISLLVFAELSQAYCVARTVCKNGQTIECALPAYIGNGLTIHPACSMVNGQSVTCLRDSYNGVGGASIYKECSLYSEASDDQYGGRHSYIPGH